MKVGVYYFPNYHLDKRNKLSHGEGWTEWELVKRAEPKFKGHIQPKVPLWGYEDEANPEVMAKKIDVASNACIDAFIFDWYWYEDGPFLNRALDEGFLGAKNSEDLHFALMWANHDWVDIHPAQRSFVNGINTLYKGSISEKAFIQATEYMINNYFNRPNYWKVQGGLYFSVYMIAGLIDSFGGIENTKRILSDFRARVRAAGLGELHLNAIVWGKQILPGETAVEGVNEMLEMLGFDSVSTYVWIHNHGPKFFPFTEYKEFAEICEKDYENFSNHYKMPYFPNVTVGWDSSPRTVASDKYDYLGYPFVPILQNDTPEAFKIALEKAKVFLEKRSEELQILTINAWNEWTEGSYLEPDEQYGYGRLEAIKAVFGKK
jgi:hypothetical protein